MTSEPKLLEQTDVENVKKDMDEHDKESTALSTEEELRILKQEKTIKKCAFTKAKNKLLLEVEEDLPSRRKIRQLTCFMLEAEEGAVTVMRKICEISSTKEDQSTLEMVTIEMEKLHSESQKSEETAQEYLDSRAGEESSIASSKVELSQRKEILARQAADRVRAEVQKQEEQYQKAKKQLEEDFKQKTMKLEEEMKNEQDRLQQAEVQLNMCRATLERDMQDELGLPRIKPEFNQNYSHHISHHSDKEEIGTDLWRQLKRVSIPVFSGDKSLYDGWRSAFLSCIDAAPATPQYKLLQLRQYLGGEALKAIEELGHSAEAYETAKERLDRKFGGKRRKIALVLEKIAKVKPLQNGNSEDFERFADVLDVAVANLKEAKRNDELGDGSLFTQLQQKMTEEMVTNYKRWSTDSEKEQSVKSLREWVLRESEFLIEAAEAVKGVSRTGISTTHRTMFGHDEDGDQSAESQDTDVSVSKNKRKCCICEKNHTAWSCDVFKQMSVDERWDAASTHRLCYRCLGENHLGRSCRRYVVCAINGCKQNHNRLLHRDVPSQQHPSENEAHNQVQKNISSPSVERSHTTLPTMNAQSYSLQSTALRTIPVILKHGKKKLKVNALLDDASTKTYVNSDVAAELGLQGELKKVHVNVLNGIMETFETMPIEVGLESLDGSIDMMISAYTTNKVTGDMQVVDWRSHAGKWKHLKNIPFPEVGKKPIVDILIGLDYADLHFSIQDVRGEQGEPIARLTPLGWTCINVASGANLPVAANFVRTYFIRSRTEVDEVSDVLRKFWEVEDIHDQTAIIVKPEDRLAAEKVERSLRYKDDHYQVAIPWKKKETVLPSNYKMAMNRLKSTERKLIKSPEIAASYKDTIVKYLQKGYISKVPNIEVTGNHRWYLPHFAVVRPEKDTTKTRIVFDASAKYQGVSLNDAIYQGPKLQRDLFQVLIRFRRFPVAVVCDIAEMYLRIELAKCDRPFHSFLWRDLELEREPDVYQFNRLVFGVNSSPYEAQFVSQYHASKNRNLYPLAAETVMQATYMDDSMDSVKGDSEGIELYEQLSKLWESAGMHARKWLSNSTVVMQKVPAKDRASEVDLDKESLPAVKTLGLLWVAEHDVFQFHVNPPEAIEFTKRSYLSKISKLFDPMGFLSPFTVRGKMMMQEIWLSGTEWDEPLPQELAVKAKDWFRELPDLSKIKIPRCLQLNQQHEVISMNLHTFVDASQDGYGACVYSRCLYKDGTVSVRLIAAKTRVTPVATMSIPRLELLGAVLGMYLTQNIADVLEYKLSEAAFWCDSMNVLFWIRGKGRRFKSFVANRIGQIQRHTNPQQWQYVSTNVNPADHLTRGMSASKLAIEESWWTGPAFLYEDESCWPVKDILKGEGADLEMKKAEISMATLSSKELPEESCIEPTRFSNWQRLVRVRGWVQRFVNNCQSEKNFQVSGELSADEMEQSEYDIIRQSQKVAFKEEYATLLSGHGLPKDSKLLSLNPKLDIEGVMRCHGRLVQTEFLPYDVQFPIILPRKDWVTRLIVKQYHEKGNHAAGTNQTLARLSARFWVIAAREEIRDWEKKCSECRKRKAKPGNQIMAPLPHNRFQKPLRAFINSSVDFGGPFITIQGRGKRREKRYLCLFTCMSTRAVHLEMAYGLDTNSFLNAFYRMANRRGLPQDVTSDNGTNFVGAEKELKELVSQLDEDKIAKSCANKGVRWHFNPPLAPHFGGVHEIMIKAAKRAINAIFGNSEVNDEELMTAFSGAEALLNSRPLTYQSANPADDTPLTPNHFLIGQMGGEFAPQSVDDTDFSPRKRWRRVQEVVRHFWKRWMQEWLPSLSSRNKWWKSQRDLKVGDVVLVVSPDTPRGQWPLGRITDIHPGSDGHVRVVRVLVGGKEMTRPITKLCPLEFGCDGDDKW